MTTTPSNDRPSPPIHPRLRQRLEQTLTRRLAAYEEARAEAWSSIAELLQRILKCNESLGRHAARDIEAECWRVLRALERARGRRLPHPMDMADLLARVRGIAAMAEALSVTLPEQAL